MTKKTVEKDMENSLSSVRILLASYLSFFSNERDKLTRLTNQLENRSNVFSRKNFTAHITASGFVVDSQKRILLIYHNNLKRWLQPGGHYEGENKFWMTAAREIEEETQLKSLKLHPWHSEKIFPIDIDTHYIPTNLKKAEDAHYHHDFRYVFLSEENASNAMNIHLDTTEVSKFVWLGLEEVEKLSPDLPLQKLRKLIFKN